MAIMTDIVLPDSVTKACAPASVTELWVILQPHDEKQVDKWQRRPTDLSSCESWRLICFTGPIGPLGSRGFALGTNSGGKTSEMRRSSDNRRAPMASLGSKTIALASASPTARSPS